MSSRAKHLAEVPRTRRVAVITGATSGIGRATALALGNAGVHVVLLGRNERAAAAVLARLQRRQREPGRVVRVDLANFQDVRRAGTEIRRHYGAIDILVNNAGARFTTYQVAAEGIERTFAINHLGHFLLSALILDLMLSAASARIITVGSRAHATVVPSGWLPTRQTYDRKAAYATSKLANIMFAVELARRMRGTSVSSNAVDPGGVATNLGRNDGVMPWLRHLLYYAAKRELRTPGRAASSIVRLALEDDYNGTSGRYFYEGREVATAAAVSDRNLIEQLWMTSVQLTGLDATIGDAWRFFDPAAVN